MNRRVAGRFLGIGVAALAAFAAVQTSFAAEAGKTPSTAATPAVSLPREVVKAATQLRDTALASDEAYQLLESLTTEVGPRFAGTAGNLAGVNWSRETLQSLDQTLALLPAAVTLPAGAEELLAARVAARAARDFAASDRLRDELAALGVLVEDSRDGQRWRIAGSN